jgi:tetratricopeptide (TPR) repeat protein
MLASIAVALLLGISAAGPRAVEAPENRLAIAERLFRQGIDAGDDHATARQAFHMAADLYQQLADAGFDNPDLFLNLGNAHLLADELPQAILAYQRGLRRHPLHPELWENLDAARDMVAYPDDAWRLHPEGDQWPPWLPRPSPAFLLDTALALYALAWVAVAAWLVWRRLPAIIVAGLLLLAATASAGWWGYLDYRVAQADQHPLVVVALNGVTLRTGNGPLYPQHARLPTVNRGMEARLVTVRGGWVQVRFPGGDLGWLPRSAVLVDEPIQKDESP